MSGQCDFHIETSRLICILNQFTGFYISENIDLIRLTNLFQHDWFHANRKINQIARNSEFV